MESKNKYRWTNTSYTSGYITLLLWQREEYYPSTAFSFAVPLEGGKESKARIKIASIDANHPVNDCGDGNATAGKSLAGIFLLGLLGGLIALITPCVFPLIPLTVSFFTKKSGSRSKGARNAFLYG